MFDCSIPLARPYPLESFSLFNFSSTMYLLSLDRVHDVQSPYFRPRPDPHGVIIVIIPLVEVSVRHISTELNLRRRHNLAVPHRATILLDLFASLPSHAPSRTCLREPGFAPEARLMTCAGGFNVVIGRNELNPGCLRHIGEPPGLTMQSHGVDLGQGEVYERDKWWAEGGTRPRGS